LFVLIIFFKQFTQLASTLMYDSEHGYFNYPTIHNLISKEFLQWRHWCVNVATGGRPNIATGLFGLC